MPRHREYPTNAQRQAAYRARHAAQQPPRQALLASLARSVHAALADAVHAGHSPLPAAVLGARADQTLENLIAYLRSSLQGDADRAPGSPPASTVATADTRADGGKPTPASAGGSLRP